MTKDVQKIVDKWKKLKKAQAGKEVAHPTYLVDILRAGYVVACIEETAPSVRSFQVYTI